MSRNENTDKSLQQWFNEHKSRGGKSQRRGRRKKIREGQEPEETKPNCAEGRKVAKNCVFSCFVVPEGRQVGSLKRQVWNHVVSWQHAAVAWSTLPDENVQSAAGLQHFWGSGHVQNVRAAVARTHTEVKLWNTPRSDRCPLWCEAHSGAKSWRPHHVRTSSTLI